MKGSDKMINNNLIYKNPNLTYYSILHDIRIFGAENLIKADVSDNDITIPDKSNCIPIGYY